jgi:hypothetical protein
MAKIRELRTKFLKEIKVDELLQKCADEELK